MARAAKAIRVVISCSPVSADHRSVQALPHPRIILRTRGDPGKGCGVLIPNRCPAPPFSERRVRKLSKGPPPPIKRGGKLGERVWLAPATALAAAVRA